MRYKVDTIIQTLFFVAIASLVIDTRPVFAKKMPTLGEIAQANEAAWATVENVDMEFAVISEIVIDGEEYLTASLQNRWIYTPDRERLTRVYDLGDSASLMSDSLRDDTSLRERQITHDMGGDLSCGTIMPSIHPIWQSKVNVSPYLLRYPCGEIDLDTAKTLGWIIENWPTTLDGSHTANGDTIWHLHVQCPVGQPWSGGVMQIEVNAQKDYLVQKVTINGLDIGFSDDEERTTVEMQIVEFVRDENNRRYFPSGFVSRQFSEPRTETSQPHTVYKEIPTRLTVNGSLPDHCFDFKFGKFEIVTEYNALSEIAAIYLWGDDDRPMETFSSYEELDRWQFRQDISALVTDYFNLSRIIGRDLGHLARDTMRMGKHDLLAERQRRQEQLRELASLPIDSTNPQPPQVTETVVVAE
jgi:hypothetical protein